MAKYVTPAWTDNAAPPVNAAAMKDIGEGIEISQHPYGVCTTASGTAAKVVTVDYSGTLTLFDGLRVTVKFSNSNSASSPTLNVNGTGAKAIKAYGTTAISTWVAGQTMSFVYDGTNWLMDSVDAYTKTQTLSNATASAIAAATGTTPATPDEAFSRLLASSLGKAKMEMGTYIGTGSYGNGNENTLTFNGMPVVLIVYKDGAPFQFSTATNKSTSNLVDAMIAFSGEGAYVNIDNGGSYLSGYNSFTWSADSVSWYANPLTGLSASAAHQLNISGETYHYFALTV